MTKILAYFGFDGTWSAAHWRLSAVWVLPPIVIGIVLPGVLGLHGVAAAAATVALIAILTAIWTVALTRSATYKRAVERLPPRRRL